MPFLNAGEADVLATYLTGGPTRYLGLVNNQFTAVASNDTFTSTNGTAAVAHGLSVGDDVFLAPIQTSATVAATAASPTIAGLTLLRSYIVKSVPTASTFTLQDPLSGTPTATVDVTADCFGGWMSETKTTMTSTGIIEVSNTGYSRIAIANTEWVNGGLLNGDAIYNGPTKTIGPAATQAFQWTHSTISSTQTGAGSLLIATAAALVATVAVGNTTQIQPKIQVS